MVSYYSGIPNTSKSVVLGHPDTLICEGIAGILLKANFRVLGKANTESNLKELASQHKPDIILFEPVICECCSDVIREFRQQALKSIIVLMTKRTVFDGITQAIEAGASGCISVEVSPEEFVRSLELLSMGDLVVSKDIANVIREELNVKQKPKQSEMLSEREREVLGHIGNGSTNRQIARKLFISEHTVKVHVRSILNKLNLQNRQQAAVYASEEGLITPLNSENSEQPTP